MTCIYVSWNEAFYEDPFVVKTNCVERIGYQPVVNGLSSSFAESIRGSRHIFYSLKWQVEPQH
jgi:hypothetical protein